MKYFSPKQSARWLHESLIKPRQKQLDRQRQEYILNVLLCGLVVAALLALIDTTINFVSSSIPHYRNSFIITLVFASFTVGLLYASRRGFYKLVSLIFVGLLSLVALQLTLQWGFMLPQVQLLYAMIIVIAGVLLSARASLLMSLLTVLFILIVSYLQVHGNLQPDMAWLHKPFYFGDAVGYAIVLMIIGLVAWLSDREIDRSLRRARQSEAELASERDSLEVKVTERTRELEEIQLLRLLELRRFAEFGRMSANLLHEITNPLTAASLNLELLHDQQNPQLVMQARKNLKHLERYVQAARKQIKGQSEIKTFYARRELSQVMSVLQSRAKQADVKLLLEPSDNFKLRGDAVKFSQIMANLISNAIDAYVRTARPAASKQVVISLKRTGSGLHCTVTDWGEGIAPHALTKIFEPFYSTKAEKHQSLGIGLAMVRQFVEQDFHGTINASSSMSDGTRFTVELHPSSTAP